jgi:SAM-dependent methyltransferase
VLTFDAIHDQAHPATVLANVRRALRPDGTYLMVDINAQSNLEDNLELPWASFLFAVSTWHCMAVSLGQGGDGLGTAWGVQTAERMLRDAGFSEVVVHDLPEDPFNAYFVARP